MRLRATSNPLRHTLAALLLMSFALPLWAQRAGEISGLVPEGRRNAATAKLRDAVDWNDLLKTLRMGRMRASLQDGSILSLGRDSELRVVQHDAASQQTQLDLSFGRLRNRVVQMTKPSAKYEVQTPNAVVGVIGTDFYIYATPDITIVIVFEGTVVVTPRGGGSGVQVNAGQMVTFGPGGAISAPRPTPDYMAQEAMSDTDVTEVAAAAPALPAPSAPGPEKEGCFTPGGELAVGFQFVDSHFPISPGLSETFNTYGPTVSGAGYVTPWVGFVGEFTTTTDRSGTTLTTFMGGPRFTFCGPKRLRFFAQTLHGASVQDSGEKGYSMTVGGGVDWFFHKGFGIRLVQADYYRFRIGQNVGDPITQQAFRYSGGLVIRFGGSK